MPRDDKRLFAPFPIEMDEHPKIIGLSDAAFRAIFEATFYSRRMMSDGFLDERVVLKRWGQAVADELGSNDPERPSWIRVENGWRIHDFEKHHPLKADIEAKRTRTSERRSEAGRIGNEKRWGRKDIANGSQSDSNEDATDRSETETETETTTPKGVEARKRARTVPADFSISERMREWAASNVPLVDIDRVLPEFIDYWRGVGKPMKDWEAVWHNGMRKQQTFAERDAGRNGTPLSKADRNAAEYQRLYGGQHERAGSFPALDPGVG